jgi:hypothetical protein
VEATAERYERGWQTRRPAESVEELCVRIVRSERRRATRKVRAEFRTGSMSNIEGRIVAAIR